VCRDPRLHAISADLASGMSQNAVAKKYGFTQPVVWKHTNQHMGAAL
jgi:transposase